jgi:hypothetical protein
VISQTEASSFLVLKCPQWVVLSQLQKPLVSRISLDSPLNALSWLQTQIQMLSHAVLMVW